MGPEDSPILTRTQAAFTQFFGRPDQATLSANRGVRLLSTQRWELQDGTQTQVSIACNVQVDGVRKFKLEIPDFDMEIKFFVFAHKNWGVILSKDISIGTGDVQRNLFHQFFRYVCPALHAAGINYLLLASIPEIPNSTFSEYTFVTQGTEEVLTDIAGKRFAFADEMFWIINMERLVKFMSDGAPLTPIS